MSVRTVLQGDIAELRKPAAKVTRFDKKLHKLLDDMAETIHHHGGIGLAAVQIGEGKQVCIVDIGTERFELINPEITSATGEQDSVESCLSFPGLTLQLKRPLMVTVKAKDRYGKQLFCDAQGLLARVICHEIDHLKGILFMDHLTDDEVFQQMLMQLGTNFAEELQAGDEDEDSQSSVAEYIERARWEEIDQATGMLADASWKITLAAEILSDHGDLLPKESLKQLEHIEDLLGKLNERWEKVLSTAPEPPIDKT